MELKLLSHNEETPTRRGSVTYMAVYAPDEYEIISIMYETINTELFIWQIQPEGSTKIGFRVTALKQAISALEELVCQF